MTHEDENIACEERRKRQVLIALLLLMVQLGSILESFPCPDGGPARLSTVPVPAQRNTKHLPIANPCPALYLFRLHEYVHLQSGCPAGALPRLFLACASSLNLRWLLVLSLRNQQDSRVVVLVIKLRKDVRRYESTLFERTVYQPSQRERDTSFCIEGKPTNGLNNRET